ncbi:hypothetical protein BD324DRAFT_613801 [Kockovaella imperatae]|uniref:Arrestin-like N-terminal domain-containing protein n=1 Tax=Kockovaella imperatae TaxID=4999 RepID=A0A1Y1UTA4_9TREE|nr:hypothetical protein BD324DRAFT_613801 [Kockovaella imperatae]ORX41248.1 hypothetical protein BD324DRAFT_613801 [Kockovaella imperatae]
MRLPFAPRKRVSTSSDRKVGSPPEIVLANKNHDRPWYGSVRTVGTESLDLEADLTIPSYGVIFLNPPEEAKIDAQLRDIEPVFDHILTGTFEISLPSHVQKATYNVIRIGVESISYLDMGPQRGIERDELFRREMVFDQSPQIIEGSITVGFSLIIPCSLALEDYHRDSSVLTSLYAVIDGKDVTPERIQSDFGSLSLSHKDQVASAKYPDPIANHAFRDRPKDQSSHSLAEITLTGQRIIERPLRMVHNPEPNGGVSILDEQIRGNLRAIGRYDIRLYSEIWTLASILKSTIAITDIAPDVTIFGFRVQVVQTNDMTSPRDGQTISKTTTVPIIQQGMNAQTLPRFPGVKAPALWRGTNAGGTDHEVFLVEAKGRIPTDTHLRPSTPPSVETPIKVSHRLGIEIYFSIAGEDASGNKLPGNVPGQLTVLSITKSVFMPSCWLMPDVLRLPKYDSETGHLCTHRQCTSVDLWDACACVLTDEQIEETFKRFAPKTTDGSEETRATTMRRKAEAEGRVWTIEEYPVE